MKEVGIEVYGSHQYSDVGPDRLQVFLNKKNKSEN